MGRDRRPEQRNSAARNVMPENIAVVPATPDQWPDVALLLGRDGDHGCWCQYWRLSSSDYRHRLPGAGSRPMRAPPQPVPAPGVLPHLPGGPAGWGGIG